MNSTVNIRPMRSSKHDMSLLLKWLTNPLVLEHVYAENAPWDFEKVCEEFTESTTGESLTVACLILYEDREVGYLQYYPIEEDSYKFNDSATYEKVKGGYGIDMFIGEPELWRKGIGSQAINVVADYLASKLNVHVICVDPATENEAGMKFWQKVGFVPLDTIEDYDDSSKQSVLMMKSI